MEVAHREQLDIQYVNADYRERYADVAGKPFDQSAPEFAVVGHKA